MFVGLDVNSKDAVAVAVGDDGRLVAGLPNRFGPGSDVDPSMRVAEYVERLQQHLSGRTELVVLTDVDLSRARPTNVRAQAYLEAAILLAARRVGARVEVVHQRTVASHLGLPASSSKEAIRSRVVGLVAAESLTPEAQRRARALGAVWKAADIDPEGLR